MELWFLDVILASTVNECALDEPGIWTSVWLSFHAAVVIIVDLWLWCRHKMRNTTRFYAACYLTLSWNSSFFACRAIDLGLGHKEWEEGRREDIAIVAAIGFAILMLCGNQINFCTFVLNMHHVSPCFHVFLICFFTMPAA